MLPRPAFEAFYFMILRLVIEDDEENVLDVSSVLHDNKIFIKIDSGLGEAYVELDEHYTKELVKFLTKQLKNFSNE